MMDPIYNRQEIHPLTFDCLGLIPRDRAVFLLMRHSVRYPVEEGTHGTEITLTPEGVQLAEKFGESLRAPIHRIFSSPSQRCVHTADLIVKGALAETEVKQDRRVGQPGPFVADNGLAGSWFLRHGPLEFAEHLLKNEAVPGTRSLEEGKRDLFDFMFSIDPPAGTLTILVSHDTIVAPLVYRILGRDGLDREDWPRMLEGAYFWKEHDGFRLLWRGEISSF